MCLRSGHNKKILGVHFPPLDAGQAVDRLSLDGMLALWHAGIEVAITVMMREPLAERALA